MSNIINPYRFAAAGGGVWDGNTYSVAFDGTNDTCSLDFQIPVVPSGRYTWTAWVETASTTAIIVGDLEPVASSPSLATTRGAIGWLEDGGSSYWIFIMGNGSSYDIDLAKPEGGLMFMDGMWHHLALVVDGYNQEMYVDGESSATWTSTVSAGTAGTEDFHIGSWGGIHYPLEGNIDEVAFFTRALSASEIETIYNSGVPADLSGDSPNGWWRMGDNDSGAGTTITNVGSTSGNNDGTLVNGAAIESNVPLGE